MANIDFKNIKLLSFNNNDLKDLSINNKLVYSINDNTVVYDFSEGVSSTTYRVLGLINDVFIVRDKTWNETRAPSSTSGDYEIDVYFKKLGIKTVIAFDPDTKLPAFSSINYCSAKCFYRPLSDEIYVIIYGVYTRTDNTGRSFMEIIKVGNPSTEIKLITSQGYGLAKAAIDVSYSGTLSGGVGVYDTFYLINRRSNNSFICSTYKLDGTSDSFTITTETTPTGEVAAVGDSFVIVREYQYIGSDMYYYLDVYSVRYKGKIGSLGNNWIYSSLYKDSSWTCFGDNKGFIVMVRDRVQKVLCGPLSAPNSSLDFPMSLRIQTAPEQRIIPHSEVGKPGSAVEFYFLSNPYDVMKYNLSTGAGSTKYKTDSTAWLPIVFSNDKKYWGDSTGKIRYLVTK